DCFSVRSDSHATRNSVGGPKSHRRAAWYSRFRGDKCHVARSWTSIGDLFFDVWTIRPRLCSRPKRFDTWFSVLYWLLDVYDYRPLFRSLESANDLFSNDWRRWNCSSEY